VDGFDQDEQENQGDERGVVRFGFLAPLEALQFADELLYTASQFI
jgi:hypothetical protein